MPSDHQTRLAACGLASPDLAGIKRVARFPASRINDGLRFPEQTRRVCCLCGVMQKTRTTLQLSFIQRDVLSRNGDAPLFHGLGADRRGVVRGQAPPRVPVVLMAMRSFFHSPPEFIDRI
jgi:hypothetical protein